MNYFLKSCIKNQRVQDTAGILRGLYRVSQGMQSSQLNLNNLNKDAKQNNNAQNSNISIPQNNFSNQQNNPIQQENIIFKHSDNQQEQYNKSVNNITQNKSKVQESIINQQKDFQEQITSNKSSQIQNQQQSQIKHEQQSDNIQSSEQENQYQQNDLIKSDNIELIEKKIPASNISRVYHFGKLGLSIAANVISSSFLQQTGIQSSKSIRQNVFNEQNAEKISIALCQMRGAPLKLAQMLSIQEDQLIPKEIKKQFEKARNQAYVMPQKQLYTMLQTELGQDWQQKFTNFDSHPVAAASIGQVHAAVDLNNKKLALKIQYPGVKKSVDSDLNNLKMLMNYTNFLPKTMFLDQIIINTRKELHEECDYRSEAQKQIKFKNLCSKYKDYHIPDVIDHLSTDKILATEFVQGDTLDFVSSNYSQEQRDHIGYLIMNLTMKELFEFKFMQTDPNPANFFYNKENQTLNLIDFGASRDFSNEFIDNYIQVIYYSTQKNKELVIKYSQNLGFLTGQENKVMKDAHAESVITVGEPFGYEGAFDFGSQDMTDRIYKLMPVMLKNRLKAPPPEVYSLHRKLSGAYLMNMNLKARVDCKSIFMNLYKEYKFSQY